MNAGWLFTRAPLPEGRHVCLMQTDNRIISVIDEPNDDYGETMQMMWNYCKRRGDNEQVAPTYH